MGSGSDGGQEAVLAVVGSAGGGTLSLVTLPRSFLVEHIRHDATHLTLRAHDGRTVRATPGQLTVHVRLLPPEHNPLYETQSTEAFLATRLLPESSWPPDRTPPVRDAVLGTIAFDGKVASYETDVVFGDGSVWVSFDGCGAARTAELVPHVRGLVESFAAIEESGREFLWASGADGTESAEEKDRLLDALEPQSLVVYRSGDFEVHYDDTSGTFCMEGYWPVVQYRADRTPVSMFVDA
ncbi:hypothetical protein [Streptomyces sp. NPDC058872]|uniref:hypothetical protein n=1 Tax=Streptomyces sp. NPDC058872 TaxID=3346661 RepID=UPI0036920F18